MHTADATAKSLGFANFKDLMEKNTPLVMSIVRRFFKDKTDAEDAAQDVWMLIATKLEGYTAKNGAKLTTWLTPVTRNRCMDLLDKEKRARYCNGMVVYENGCTGQGEDGEAFSLEDLYAGLHSTDDPMEILIADQTAERLALAYQRMEKSLRSSKYATRLDLDGFDSLAELYKAGNAVLADSSPEFLARVLLQQASFDTEATHRKAVSAVTNTLKESSPQGEPFVPSVDALFDICLEFGMKPELRPAQIAELINDTTANVRVHMSRGIEHLLDFAAPDYLAARRHNRTAARSTVQAELVDE